MPEIVLGILLENYKDWVARGSLIDILYGDPTVEDRTEDGKEAPNHLEGLSQIVTRLKSTLPKNAAKWIEMAYKKGYRLAPPSDHRKAKRH